MKKILFIGASGYGNLGDDCYKHLFAKYLNDQYDIAFDSPYPNLEMVDNCDHLIIGGGGLIYDVPNNLHFRYMTSYIDRARKKKIPYSFISVGVQIYKHKIDDKKEAMIKRGVFEIERWYKYLYHAQAISVRSETCQRIILQLTKRNDIEYFPDLGYLMTPAPYKRSLGKENVFIITPSNTLDKDFLQIWENTKKEKRLIVILSLDDLATGADLAHQINEEGNNALKRNLTPSEACQIIQDAKMIFTGRYHGNVFARAVGKRPEEIINFDKRYKSLVEDNEQDLRKAINHISTIKKII